MGSIARWLWMTHDRIDGDELPFTQAYLAVTLGVRRAGVTVAPETLETDDLIRRRRGIIVVSDRKRLEETASASYGVPEEEQRRTTSMNESHRPVHGLLN